MPKGVARRGYIEVYDVLTRIGHLQPYHMGFLLHVLSQSRPCSRPGLFFEIFQQGTVAARVHKLYQSYLFV